MSSHLRRLLSVAAQGSTGTLRRSLCSRGRGSSASDFKMSSKRTHCIHIGLQRSVKLDSKSGRPSKIGGVSLNSLHILQWHTASPPPTVQTASHSHQSGESISPPNCPFACIPAACTLIADPAVARYSRNDSWAAEISVRSE
jgi:hypothetical protein